MAARTPGLAAAAAPRGLPRLEARDLLLEEHLDRVAVVVAPVLLGAARDPWGTRLAGKERGGDRGLWDLTAVPSVARTPRRACRTVWPLCGDCGTGHGAAAASAGDLAVGPAAVVTVACQS
eukprot:237005-Alexandrium_andersonii.AAC.1